MFKKKNFKIMNIGENLIIRVVFDTGFDELIELKNWDDKTLMEFESYLSNKQTKIKDFILEKDLSNHALKIDEYYLLQRILLFSEHKNDYILKLRLQELCNKKWPPRCKFH